MFRYSSVFPSKQKSVPATHSCKDTTTWLIMILGDLVEIINTEGSWHKDTEVEFALDISKKNMARQIHHVLDYWRCM